MRYATIVLFLTMASAPAQRGLDPTALEREGVSAGGAVPELLREAQRAAGARRSEHLRAVSVLLRGLDEAAGRGDTRALRTLRRVAPAAARRIADLLGDATRAQRFHLYAALGAIGTHGEPAVPGLVAWSVGADPVELAVIAHTLGRIAPRSRAAVPAIERLLHHPDAVIRVDATHACRRLGALAAPFAGRLAELASDRRADTRANALIALAGLGPGVARHVPVILAALEDPGREVRFAAVWALDRTLASLSAAHPAVDVPLAVTRTARLLGEADDDVRWWAASCLSRIGPAAVDATPALVERLAVERGPVQESVAWALNCIGPRAESLPELCGALDHGSPYTRRVVIRILESYGRAAAAALPALQAMLDEGRTAGGTVPRLIRSIRRRLDGAE